MGYFHKHLEGSRQDIISLAISFIKARGGGWRFAPKMAMEDGDALGLDAFWAALERLVVALDDAVDDAAAAAAIANVAPLQMRSLQRLQYLH
jgi:hypothetical protein